MEDLDAEILAVTDPTRKPVSKNDSDGSASDGRDFDGVADSENGDMDDDDDDVPSDRDDDDDFDDRGDNDDEDMDDVNDDDDEGGDADDEDDGDYGVSSKKRAKKKASSKSKKPPAKKVTKRKKPTKKRSQESRRSGTKISLEDIDDDDEEEFHHMYDENGYGDAADRERLEKMTEVDREIILMERVDNRRSAYEMWIAKKNLQAREKGKRAEPPEKRSSGRAKSSSKSDALQNLAEARRKKSRLLDTISDGDSEPERTRKRLRTSRDDESLSGDDGKKSSRRGSDLDKDFHSGPELSYTDLVKEDSDHISTPLFLRRGTLLKLSQQPFFARAVEGLFVRVRVAGNTPHSVGSYLLCRVAGIESGSVYRPAPDVRTNSYLILQIGKTKRKFPIELCSASHPTRSEFDVFRNRCHDVGMDLPNREEVNQLLKKATTIIAEGKVKATEEEYKEHLTNMEVLYPERTNWTQKRAEVQTTLEIKRQDLEIANEKGDAEECAELRHDVMVLEDRLREVEELEAKYTAKMTGSATKVFQSLARKNRVLNSTMDRLAASRRSLGNDSSGIDPFARFDTTGQSYFSIGKGGQDDVKSELQVQTEEQDWRKSLRTWVPGAPKSKIRGKALDVQYAVELVGLEDFILDSKYLHNSVLQDAFIPPGVDAVYSTSCRRKENLPSGAKVISFEEWNKMRQ